MYLTCITLAIFCQLLKLRVSWLAFEQTDKKYIFVQIYREKFVMKPILQCSDRFQPFLKVFPGYIDK